MEELKIILLTLAVYLILEGLVLAIAPKPTLKTIKKTFKKPKDVQGVGLIELIIAFLLIFLVFII